MAREEHSPARAAVLNHIQDGLTTISRRGQARARASLGALSSVDHSILTFVQGHPAPRAIDISDHFGLNRSTVSRQLAALTRQGLIRDCEPGEVPGARGTVLALTHDGEQTLARSAAVIGASMTERLRDWSEQDLQVFAQLIRRYNDASE